MRHSEQYSDALGLGYEYKDGTLHFEDGVDYSLAEAVEIAEQGATPEDIKAIHLTKAAFDGVLQTRFDLPVKPPARRKVPVAVKSGGNPGKITPQKSKYMTVADLIGLNCTCGGRRVQLVPSGRYYRCCCPTCGKIHGMTTPGVAKTSLTSPLVYITCEPKSVQQDLFKAEG